MFANVGSAESQGRGTGFAPARRRASGSPVAWSGDVAEARTDTKDDLVKKRSQARSSKASTRKTMEAGSPSGRDEGR